MKDRDLEISPGTLSRVGGALYLVIIALGIFGEAFVRERIVVSGDAVRTAANLHAMESLWRLGITTEFTLLLCATALTAIFYVLLAPVSRTLALLATFFNLVSISIEAVSGLFLIQTLFPLGDAGYLKAFTAEQLAALARMSVRAHGNGFSIALLFFALVCVFLGILIFKSGFLPRAIGVGMMIAGVCYGTDSFLIILTPVFADRLFPAILIPSFIGELSFCLWLLTKGVNVENWRARKAANSFASDP
jgi:hypothetical protein